MTASGEEFAELAAQWDERYSASELIWRPEANEVLVELASPLPPGTALDLGAGEGRNSLWLAEQGWQVEAVDASAVGLAKAAALASHSDLLLNTHVGDLWEFMETAKQSHRSFDLLVLAYIQVLAAERSLLLERAAALVAPGGHLFVIAHHIDSLGIAGPPDPQRLFLESDLEAIPGLVSERLGLWHGSSDVSQAATDVYVWATRPSG